MPLPHTDPHPEADMGHAEDTPAKPADFMVDSAGNVAPSTKRKAESLAGRTAPPRGRWSRPD